MKKVLAIIGPTASGKTSVAIECAVLINGEVISADSRQVYKHIPIASAIPSLKEKKEIPHHFMEELNLNEDFNAGDFGKIGRERISEIFDRGKQPIIAGGSGLYIRSLVDGLFEEEVEDTRIREELYQKLKTKGKEFLYDELKEIDKIAAAAMLPANIRRVIRALEIYYATGKKISDLHQQKIDINFKTVQVGLMWDRGELYDRINNRVDAMLDAGLVDEIRALKDIGFNPDEHNSLNTVGIKEVFRYLDNDITQSEMISLIKQNTRRYAKRQMTWFRKDKRINWVNLSNDSDISQLAGEIVSFFEDFNGEGKS